MSPANLPGEQPADQGHSTPESSDTTHQELTDRFKKWADSQGFQARTFSIMGVQYLDGRPTGEPVRQEVMRFNARLRAYDAAPPPGTQWDSDPKRTGQGSLLRQGLLQAAIEDMRTQSYKDGPFKESGGACFGIQCHHDTYHYGVGFSYVPLPTDSSINVRRDSVSLEFSPDGWGAMVRAQDQLERTYDLGHLRLSLPIWVHCHPGGASASVDDAGVQTFSSGWVGIIVGNDLLRNGFAGGQEDVAQIIRQRQLGQLSTITDEGVQSSIGIANPVTIAEHYLGLDTLQSHELPLVTKPVVQQADELEITIEPIGEEDEIVIEDSDLTPVADESLLDEITITLDIPPEGDTGDEVRILETPKLTISKTGPKREGIPDIVINIRDVTPGNVERILEMTRKLLGF